MGSNGNKSAAAELVARCEAVGWQVSRTGNGHYRVDTRKGVFTVSSTPGDVRSVKNSEAEARRYGLEDLEIKLGKRTAQVRQRKIDDDRAANDAKLARLEAKVREFSRTGSTDVAFKQPDVDPTKDVGLGKIDGIAIVAIAPAMLKTAVMSEARPLRDGEELLLANEAIVYRCRKRGPWSTTDNDTPADQLCESTFSAPGSLRSHIGFHTMRAIRDADYALATAQEAQEKEVSNVALANANAKVAVKTPAPVAPLTPTTTDDLKVQLTATLTTLVAGTDTIGSATIEVRNALLKLIDLVQELKTEVIVQEPDPELVAKAAQFDALAATLGSLIKPVK